MIQVAIRTERFQATMKDFSQRLGIALPLVVKAEAKSLLAEVIKWTPPFKSGSSEGTSRNIGKQAVTRDIRRAIYPMVESEWREPGIKRAISEENTGALVAILKNSRGNVKNPVFRAFNSSIHKNARDPRGRVQRPKGVFTFNAAAQKAYSRKVETRVGMAKGSWAAAYNAAGGKTPAWMMKASAQSKGAASTFVNNLNDPVKPSMSITSTALGVRGNNKLKSQINFAMELRSKAMAAKARRMLKDPVKYEKLFDQYK